MFQCSLAFHGVFFFAFFFMHPSHSAGTRSCVQCRLCSHIHSFIHSNVLIKCDEWYFLMDIFIRVVSFQSITRNIQHFRWWYSLSCCYCGCSAVERLTLSKNKQKDRMTWCSSESPLRFYTYAEKSFDAYVRQYLLVLNSRLERAKSQFHLLTSTLATFKIVFLLLSNSVPFLFSLFSPRIVPTTTTHNAWANRFVHFFIGNVLQSNTIRLSLSIGFYFIAHNIKYLFICLSSSSCSSPSPPV